MFTVEEVVWGWEHGNPNYKITFIVSKTKKKPKKRKKTVKFKPCGKSAICRAFGVCENCDGYPNPP